MKKNLGKYIGILLAIICIILLITFISIKVSSVNAKPGESDLKEKLSEEIKYLDSNIIELMNKINNIDVIKYKVYNKEINDPSSDKSSSNSQSSSQGSSQESSSKQSESKEGSNSSEGSSQNQESNSNQNSNSESSESQSNSNSKGGESQNTTSISELVPNTTLDQDNKEVDWKQISFIAENIYSTWPTVNLDLQEQGISNEYISSFALSMDEMIKSIKNKDKENTLINLFNMYINIPIYATNIKEEEFKINLYNTKLNILNSYTLVSTSDKWDNISDSITKAKSYFSPIISSENEDQKRKNNLQKTYLIIEDLERITDFKDPAIFYMQYKNVIQELETL